MRLIHWCVTVALLTASFDIFLFVNVAGATLRLCEVMLVLTMLVACAHVARNRILLWPRGGYAILLWVTIQGILTFRSVIPLISFELYALMLIPIFGIFALLQLYGRSRWLPRLMKSYLGTFGFVACFALFQFVAPALHLGSPLITQWILHGLIPRVNGFSYEPSFFGTYMIMGWITLIELRVLKAPLVAGRTWFWIVILISISLLLSTSKTAWVLMLLEGLLRLFSAAKRLIRLQWIRLRAGYLRIPTISWRAFVAVAATVTLSAVVVARVSHLVDLNIFLSGSGINGAPSHSVDQRASDFSWTREVIREHPWVGIGLGGVSGRIGELKGMPVHNAADAKLNWGFPVPVEVFAASGLFGFIPFLWFFVEITWGERRLLKEHPNDERSKWLRALIRGLIFEWLFLAADQNLVRMSLWFHITVLVIVAYNLRYATTGQPTLADRGQALPA